MRLNVLYCDKDMPGTSKFNIPRIVVTPPTPATTTKSVMKTKKRPSKACHRVASPTKILLNPGFWSDQPQTTRTKKKRYLFKCRNADCKEQFSSTRQRVMHEGHCFTIDEVLISNPYITVITLNYTSGVQFMYSFSQTKISKLFSKTKRGSKHNYEGQIFGYRQHDNYDSALTSPTT